MSHSKEIWHFSIRKSIKFRGECTRANKFNGNFGQISKEKNMCRSYRPQQNVVEIGLNLTYYWNLFSPDPSCSEVLNNAQEIDDDHELGRYLMYNWV